TWNNGDAFNADDVVANLNRWCEKGASGNSMAARVGALIDTKTGKAKDGAITKVDDHTVKLKLNEPDIAIIPGLTDYPALVVHRDFDKDGADPTTKPIGTGAFELVSYAVGQKAVVKRRENGKWWGGEAPLDSVEFIDYGTDFNATLNAFESGEIDLDFETPADFIDALDKMDLVKSEVATATTLVARTNVTHKPYDDQRVRNALQMAVDNDAVMQLGYAGRGTVGENHHVAPIHPEYYPLPKKTRDAAGAKKLMADAGQADFEHELITVEDEWQKNTGDAIAGQLRDAGIKVKRTVLPGSTFWNDWTKYPYSMTIWYMRPLGVQVLALGYRTGEAWNETAYSNPDFDAKLKQALSLADPAQRKEVMKDVEQILQDSGVIIQPFWQKLYCHMSKKVKNYGMHQTYEMDFQNVWLDA
ncbi:MAG: ABC transporter substrate-binding protein, partial [Mesorhizobium sp.]